MKLQLIQRTTEWLDFKKEHLGSSEVSSILGVNPYKSANSLFKEKTGQKKEKATTSAMAWGNMLEATARQAYEEEMGVEIWPLDPDKNDLCFVHNEYEFLMASLDGLSKDGKIVIEIKCPKTGNTLEMAKAGFIAEHYMIQVQEQMLVAKAEMCHFWVFDPEKGFGLVKVIPNLEMQEKILTESNKFWDKIREFRLKVAV